MPKSAPHLVQPGTVLATMPLPPMVAACMPELTRIPGKRRDRMVVVGYAADQFASKQAKWVVRCDCGNFEHRTRILRWLGTQAPDMCRECRNRAFKLRGEWNPRDKALRLDLRGKV